MMELFARPVCGDLCHITYKMLQWHKFKETGEGIIVKVCRCGQVRMGLLGDFIDAERLKPVEERPVKKLDVGDGYFLDIR